MRYVQSLSALCPSHHRALLLPEVRVRRFVVGGDHVGRVPPAHRRRGALHHHQPDGGLGGLRVRSVLLGGIFAPAVIHDTGYEENQEQDNVAGDEDAKVQSDGVDLLVVFQKAHGACFMLALRPWRSGGEGSNSLPLDPPQSVLSPSLRLQPLRFRSAPLLCGFAVKIL